MADSELDALTAASTLTGTELFYVNQSSNNRKATSSQIKDYVVQENTLAAWVAANTVLADRQIGVETDTLRLKVGDGTTAWNSLGYAGNSLTAAQIHPIISGQYIDAMTVPTAAITTAGVADRLELVPYVPPRDITLASIGINCTVGAGSSNMKVGIYLAGADGLPGALVVESTNLDTSGTGYIAFTYTGVLRRGALYWLFVRSSGTPTVSALNPAQCRPILRTGPTNQAAHCIRKTLTFATGAANPFGSVAAGDLAISGSVPLWLGLLP
jgi:hypothetical protein